MCTIETFHCRNFQAFRESPSSRLHTVDIIRGPLGFGFTIASTSHGQCVKQILDKPRCRGLAEADLLVTINSTAVRNMSHAEVVEILKTCPLGSVATFVVERIGQVTVLLTI